MGVDRNRLEGGFSMSGAWLVLLACCTSSHIILCEFLHVSSLIGLTEEMYGIRDAWMSSKGMVVICS